MRLVIVMLLLLVAPARLCPSTCYSATCDTWTAEGKTCAELQSWGCDCTGCSCSASDNAATGGTATALAAVQGQLPKILCLHGGGGSAAGFESSFGGSVALRDALSQGYELVFAQTPLAGGKWIEDPPGGKSNPTTDPQWASTSVTYLNALVASSGPFHGILGYSQGAAMAIVYLSQGTATFDVALLFCGYLPSTHTGLMATISASSPFGGNRALVFLGANDYVISNEMSLAAAAEFTSPTIVTSAAAGHNLPSPSDPTFDDVLSFLASAPPPAQPVAPPDPSTPPGVAQSPPPPPPSPPSPPLPSPPPSTETVVLSITASGSVSDYADTGSLQQSIASAAGVHTSLVTVSVAAASVIITATIAVPAATTAAAVQATLSASLPTAATATAALGIPVESVPFVTLASPPPLPPLLPPPYASDTAGLRTEAIIGIAVGVGAVVLLVVLGIAFCRRRGCEKGVATV